MDPKKPADLDPKLKEIYERVMGTNVAASKTPPSTTPVVPTPPIAKPVAQPRETAPQVAPAPLTAEPASSAKTSTGKVFLEHQSFTPQLKKTEEKKQQNMLPMLLFIGGVVFFAVYAFFWLKFFNVNLVSLPF